MIRFKVPKVKTNVSWHEKLIRTNFVQRFLAIFRDTEDIHRVLAIVPVVLVLSHSWFIKNAVGVSVVVAQLNNSEILWLTFSSIPILFMLFWAVFSSPFNLYLYWRQIIIGAWALLIHRLAYGLTQLGTADFYVLAFAAFVSFLPFALTGQKIEQFFDGIKQRRESANNRQPAVIMEDENDESEQVEAPAA